MKHNIPITAILLAMFFITQLIGLGVIHAYNTPVDIFNETTQQYEQVNVTLPYGMEPPEDIKPLQALPMIIIAMIIAVSLIFLLMTIKAATFLRIWFFIVVVIAIGIFLNAIFLLFKLSFPYQTLLAAIIALPLAVYKIFRRNLIIHNLTELVIYPGIAAVFVPILNSIWPIIILLILISLYDIYAVWHSGFMQKMAKFQINQLKFFTGFFVPYVPSKDRIKIKNLKKGEKKNVKVSLAILGGGDVIFPIIAAGVVFLALGFWAALLVSVFATLALLFLFGISKKGKFYPAMPFISVGIFIGMALAYLIF